MIKASLTQLPLQPLLIRLHHKLIQLILVVSSQSHHNQLISRQNSRQWQIMALRLILYHKLVIVMIIALLLLAYAIVGLGLLSGMLGLLGIKGKKKQN